MNKEKFPATTEGCDAARKWLKENNALTPRVERMDGYSLIHYANELYNSPKTKKR